MEVDAVSARSKKHGKRKMGGTPAQSELVTPQLEDFADHTQNGESPAKKKHKKRQALDEEQSVAPEMRDTPAKRKKTGLPQLEPDSDGLFPVPEMENGDVDASSAPRSTSKGKKRKQDLVVPTPPKIVHRPSLSLMSATPSFFAAPVASTSALPDIAVDPILREETDTRAFLRSFNEEHITGRMRAARLGGNEEESATSVHRIVSAEELETARAQNEKDNLPFAENGTASMKLSKAIPTTEIEGQKAMAECRSLPHEDILATKWYTSQVLAHLARGMDLVYKTGHFTAAEDTIIRAAAQRYQTRYGMSKEDFVQQVNSQKKGDTQANKAMWGDIARELGYRGLQAVAKRGKRLYAEEGEKGEWTEAEDATLRKAVETIGSVWLKVAAVVGRPDKACKEHYHELVTGKEKKTPGSGQEWTAEEEYALDMAVRKTAKDLNIDILTTPTPDLPFTAISKELNGLRTRLQCKGRWSEQTYRMLIGRGTPIGWTRYDEYLIIKGVYEQKKATLESVDWEDLWTPDWCRWPAALMRRRYLRMVKSSKEASKKETHAEKAQAMYDTRVDGVDPEQLNKPEFGGWRGLKKLPDVPMSSYGVKTKKLYTTSRRGEVKHRKLKKRKGAAIPSDEEDAEDATQTIKSSEFINDSDEEAA